MGVDSLGKFKQFCDQVGGEFEKKGDSIAVCTLPLGKEGTLRASDNEVVFSVGNVGFGVRCEGGFSRIGKKRATGIKRIEFEVLDNGCKIQFE